MTMVFGAFASVKAAFASIPRQSTPPAVAGVLERIDTLLMIPLILSVTVVTARVLSALIMRHAARGEGIAATSILTNVTRAVVWLVGLLVLCETMGVSIAPVLGALGVGGLAVALALQDTLGNLFAGIHIIISRHVRVSDFVRLDSGEEGRVQDIGWRNTTIRTITDTTLVVPNAKLASMIVTNYDLPTRAIIFHVRLGVAYGSDLDRVEQVALEIAQAIVTRPGGVADPPPKVLFHTCGDSSIDFNVVLRCQGFNEQFALKHEFIKAVTKRFAQEGIDIPFPQRAVHLVPPPAPAPAPAPVPAPSHG
jgi:small-conductance mechanosensitive channel